MLKLHTEAEFTPADDDVEIEIDEDLTGHYSAANGSFAIVDTETGFPLVRFGSVRDAAHVEQLIAIHY